MHTGESLHLKSGAKVKCFSGRGLYEEDLFKPCCRTGNDRIPCYSIRMRYLHSQRPKENRLPHDGRHQVDQGTLQDLALKAQLQIFL